MEYNKIYNFEKNDWVSIYSKVGRNTLKKYLSTFIKNKKLNEKIGGWGPPPSNKDEENLFGGWGTPNDDEKY